MSGPQYIVGLVTFFVENGDEKDASPIPVTLIANGIQAVQYADKQSCIVTDGNGFDWPCVEAYETVLDRWATQLRFFK